MSKRAIDHDRFVGKMNSMARAEEMDKRDQRKEDLKPKIEEKSCMTCDKKRSCKTLNGKINVSGVYSIGGEAKVSTCNQWKARKDNPNDPKKIKNLLKQFTKANNF